MSITFVKKILADGTPCPKCADVEARLHDGGHWSRIDRVVIADERDAASEGMRLAARLGVKLAPFFVVDAAGTETVYTVYFRFAREVLGASTATRAEEASDLLRANPDLELL